MNDTNTFRRRLYNKATRACRLTALAVLAAACGGNESPVDPAMVGSWEITVPTGRWLMTIDAAGAYAFVNQGSGPAPSHSGQFVAQDGRWSLRSTTSALEDQGTYELAPDGVLLLTGNLGSLRWGRTSPEAAGTAAVQVPQPQAPPTTAVVPPSASPTPVNATAASGPAPATAPPPAAAPASTAPVLPDIIDPCLLVTAEEATQVLGVSVSAERKTPQAKTQNDCLYRASGRTLSVTSYNGRGIDPVGYLERRRSEGGQPLAGVGDGATWTYREATGITSLDFVIGTATFDILIAGVPRDRAEPAIRALATQAAARLTTAAAAFRVPGTERFVGTWLVSTHTDTGRELPRSVFWVEPDGGLRMQSSGGLSGTLLLTGSSWRIEGRWDQEPVSGEYRLRGDSLTFEGVQLEARLTRVACGAAAKTVRPPYDLTRDIADFLRGRGLARLKVDEGGADPFNTDLAGLWEGEGAINGRKMQALVSIDDRGRSVFGLFPYAAGRIEARDGSYRVSLEGYGDSTGTYRLEGGISDGSLELKEEGNTMTWTPYDTNLRRPYDTPIVGHCD